MIKIISMCMSVNIILMSLAFAMKLWEEDSKFIAVFILLYGMMIGGFCIYTVYTRPWY